MYYVLIRTAFYYIYIISLYSLKKVCFATFCEAFHFSADTENERNYMILALKYL